MFETGADIMVKNKVFGWIAAVTGLILLIPLIAMQFTSQVNWNVTDFIVMGAFIFGSGSLFVLTARKTDKKYWIILGLGFVIAFLWLWAELAVGIFTGWGN